jgi:hypothetical protein
MKHLIIPDVHERLDRLEQAMRHIKKADRYIFLGDWFDTFKKFDEQRLKSVCHFIVSMIGDAKTLDISTWLLGNHDCHYFFNNLGFQCSGFDWNKKALIKNLIPRQIIERFQIYQKVGGYVLSHAGFHTDNLDILNPPALQAQLIEQCLRGNYPRAFESGRARGGYAKLGGPTWLDWNHEFRHIDGMPQIVGHTQTDIPRRAHESGCPMKMVSADSAWGHAPVEMSGSCSCNPSYCIDTSLRHVAILDDITNKVEILDVEA